MGIVKKNSIILVDYANSAARWERASQCHVAAPGPTRLRPILMTTIATMMAAVPQRCSRWALAPRPAQPMAARCIGGLTLLRRRCRLLVVPAFYVVGLSPSAIAFAYNKFGKPELAPGSRPSRSRSTSPTPTSAR
jgi:multidrug efflux pump subunit AcrB